jgi:hypothetical protein
VLKTLLSAFTQALAELGWTDGRNVRMDLRSGRGDANRMRAGEGERGPASAFSRSLRPQARVLIPRSRLAHETLGQQRLKSGPRAIRSVPTRAGVGQLDAAKSPRRRGADGERRLLPGVNLSRLVVVEVNDFLQPEADGRGPAFANGLAGLRLDRSPARGRTFSYPQMTSIR